MGIAALKSISESKTVEISALEALAASLQQQLEGSYDSVAEISELQRTNSEMNQRLAECVSGIAISEKNAAQLRVSMLRQIHAEFDFNLDGCVQAHDIVKVCDKSVAAVDLACLKKLEADAAGHISQDKFVSHMTAHFAGPAGDDFERKFEAYLGLARHWRLTQSTSQNDAADELSMRLTELQNELKGNSIFADAQASELAGLRSRVSKQATQLEAAKEHKRELNELISKMKTELPQNEGAQAQIVELQAQLPLLGFQIVELQDQLKAQEGVVQALEAHIAVLEAELKAMVDQEWKMDQYYTLEEQL